VGGEDVAAVFADAAVGDEAAAALVDDAQRPFSVRKYSWRGGLSW
jgi:hypothetical protein